MAAPSDSEEVESVKEYLSPIVDKIFVNLGPEAFFHSLVIDDCNGRGPWPFSDATIEYSSDCYGKPILPAMMWYGGFFRRIAKVFHKKDSTTSFKKTIRKLLQAVSLVLDQHRKCLRQLLEEDHIDEEKIKCILAIHYFKPLSKNSACLVDECQTFKTCSVCGESIRADEEETSFGNTLVWHGQADILVDKCVVKICTRHVEEHMNEIKEQDGDTEEEDPEMYCTKNIEEETEDNKAKRRKTYSKAIAQAIVNAFVLSIQDSSLFDKFIPSFLATEKAIRIILYNCKLDKLLFSDELSIWDQDNSSLNILTMILVWLELNNLGSTDFLDDPATRFFTAETPVCRFKEITRGAYETYLKSVSRPTMEQQKQPPRENEYYEYFKSKDDYFLIMDEFRREFCQPRQKNLSDVQ